MTVATSLLIAQIVLAARPDLSLLNTGQRLAFDRVAQDEFCGCDSALTLSGCLQMRPDCAVADHLGRLAFLAAQANLPASEILSYVSDRVMGPFCSRQRSIDINGAPVKGPKRAAVTIVEFADFRCPHCKQAAAILKDAYKGLSKKVRFVFVPFPLQDHPISVVAAEASLAAQAQGRFWEMHDALFDHQDEDFSPEVLLKAAKQAGLDLKKFQSDLAAKTFRSKVGRLKDQGVKAGVQGTPALFVNGRPYEIDPTLFTLADRVAMERDRNRGKCQ